MMKEGKQIFDLLLIQIHSAQLADPFCWGRSAQHNGWNVGWEPFPKRTESPEAVTEFTWTRQCRLNSGAYSLGRGVEGVGGGLELSFAGLAFRPLFLLRWSVVGMAMCVDALNVLMIADTSVPLPRRTAHLN